MSVKEFAKWTELFLKLPEKKRREWVEKLMDAVKKTQPEMYKVIRSEYIVAGFSCNLGYILHEKRSGLTDEDLGAIMIHAWGSPKLLLKHKKLPALLICGVDINLDKSVLDELKDNDNMDVLGFTG